MADTKKHLEVLKMCKEQLSETSDLLDDITDIVEVFPKKYRNVLQTRLFDVTENIVMLYRHVCNVTEVEK